MAYLGQRTFASFEKKARGWGDFFEEEEFGQDSQYVLFGQDEDKEKNKEPEKVSDYDKTGTYLSSISRESVAGRSYYEGLVKEFFITSFQTADKNEQSAVYQKVWENSPMRNSTPFITKNTEKLFAINLASGETVYYKVIYKKHDKFNTSGDKYLVDIELISATRDEVYTTTEAAVYAEDIYMEDTMMAEATGGLDYDFTFPAIPEDEKGKYPSRQNAFFKNPVNKEAKYAYYAFINEEYKKSYY